MNKSLSYELLKCQYHLPYFSKFQSCLSSPNYKPELKVCRSTLFGILNLCCCIKSFALVILMQKSKLIQFLGNSQIFNSFKWCYFFYLSLSLSLSLNYLYQLLFCIKWSCQIVHIFKLNVSIYCNHKIRFD